LRSLLDTWTRLDAVPAVSASSGLFSGSARINAFDLDRSVLLVNVSNCLSRGTIRSMHSVNFLGNVLRERFDETLLKRAEAETPQAA